VLWVSAPDGADRGLLIVGLLRAHCGLLVECLDRLPLEEATRTCIHAYLAFLCDVVAAGEWTDVALTLDVRALAATLRAPLTFHRLTDYHIESFDHVGDDGDWRPLAELVELLESRAGAPRPPMFRVAWGF
jgi:hypothetical protein